MKYLYIVLFISILISVSFIDFDINKNWNTLISTWNILNEKVKNTININDDDKLINPGTKINEYEKSIYWTWMEDIVLMYKEKWKSIVTDQNNYEGKIYWARQWLINILDYCYRIKDIDFKDDKDAFIEALWEDVVWLNEIMIKNNYFSKDISKEANDIFPTDYSQNENDYDLSDYYLLLHIYWIITAEEFLEYYWNFKDIREEKKFPTWDFIIYKRMYEYKFIEWKLTSEKCDNLIMESWIKIN